MIGRNWPRRLPGVMALFVALLIPTVALCYELPPDRPPDWWTIPPGDSTRLEYHAFSEYPHKLLPPDYSLSGRRFKDIPADEWLIILETWDTKDDPPDGYGDRYGARFTRNSVLEKRMFNVALDGHVKY